MTEVQVRWFSSLAELRGLGEAYDRFLLEASDDGLFYRTGWIERIWAYYLAYRPSRIAFLWAERGGEPIGLAPLQISTKGWEQAFRRTLHFFGETWDALDNWVPGFVIRPGEERAAMTGFASALAREAGRWDSLELRLVPDTFLDRAPLFHAFPMLRESRETIDTPIVRVESFERYKKAIGSRLLRMIKRGEKRLEESGLEVRWTCTTTVDERRFAEVAEIHRRRQAQVIATGRRRDSMFDDPSRAGCLRSLLDWAARAGHGRHYWLEVDGKLVAFIVGFVSGRSYYYYLTSMDPSAEAYHPGALMLFRLIEAEATQHGTQVVNLLPGTTLTKTLVATEVVPNFRLETPNTGRLVSRARCAWVERARGLRELGDRTRAELDRLPQRLAPWRRTP